ncbi:hypothetical protein [Ideonella livida]|uniref:Uncharacterized protein n=1 Tax=Ideonella livida TaxID=2707176 RepID=A0A7C9PIV8_9BURK|nr:hypothetical protein [Ideonella livida]NDY93135.1 hypothetical protein [Ideonella livida]
MSCSSRWQWGGARFGEDQEHEQFRYRFLLAVLGIAVLITAVFTTADALGAVSLSAVHRWVVRVFLVANLLTFGLLWGHPQRFGVACWAHWGLSLVVNLSGLLNSPADELRVIWFFMHLSGSFILLGAWVGAASGVVLWATACCGRWRTACSSSSAPATWWAGWPGRVAAARRPGHVRRQGGRAQPGGAAALRAPRRLSPAPAAGRAAAPAGRRPGR